MHTAKVALSGEAIDAHFRKAGGFSLTNLEGTVIVYYSHGVLPESLRVHENAPKLVALRNFLITQARLGK